MSYDMQIAPLSCVLGRGNPQNSPLLRRAGQGRMGHRDVFQAGDGVLGKVGRSPGGHGDVQGHPFRSRNQPIFTMEVLTEVKPFAVVAEELPAHGKALPQT